MFSRIRHVAAVAVIALATVSFSHHSAFAQGASTQVQLPQTVADQVAAAMQAGTPAQVLAQLRAILNANPALAGAIASQAGQTTPALAQAIGTQAAEAVSQSALPPAQKAAQVQLAARGLAQANPNAATEILTTILTVVQADPAIQQALAPVIAEVAPAAGTPPPPPPPIIVVVVVPDEEFTPIPINDNDLTGS